MTTGCTPIVPHKGQYQRHLDLRPYRFMADPKKAIQLVLP